MKPADETELSEAVASTLQPLAITGGGTRPIGPSVAGKTLEVSSLAGIRRYEPEALTLVAGAGTALSDIDRVLAAERQRLAFEPMDHRTLLGRQGEPTIGGTVAANVSGSRRIQAGACRDHLLGVRFVDGMGTVIKNGGRVMKNVTGYDLVRLLAGSFGTLGILTEIAIKVLPDTECKAGLLIHDLKTEEAIQALSAALQSPYEVTGAAHTPSGIDGHPVTMIRLEGFEEQVDYRTKQLKAVLSKFGEIQIEMNQEKVNAGWKWVRDVETFKDRPGEVWKLSVKSSDGPKIVRRIQAEVDADILFDWGGALIWVLVAAGTGDIRRYCEPMAGHATLVRASESAREQIPTFHPQGSLHQRLSDGIRRQFDPRQILNPGLMN